MLTMHAVADPGGVTGVAAPQNILNQKIIDVYSGKSANQQVYITTLLWLINIINNERA